MKNISPKPKESPNKWFHRKQRETLKMIAKDGSNNCTRLLFSLPFLGTQTFWDPAEGRQKCQLIP